MNAPLTTGAPDPATRLLIGQKEIIEGIVSGRDLAGLLTSICRLVETQSDNMLCSILLLDGARKHLLLGAAPSLPEAYNLGVHNLPVGDGVGSCGTAAFRNERVVVSDIRTHPYWTSCPGILSLAEKAGLVSCWSEPVRSSKGELLGTFAVYRKHAGVPDESDISLIQQASNLASIAIERKHAEDMIWRQAN
ncbi:MAG: GAF domain-containing protein, partial [Burkholderiales bacterium]|nr:GAF domain-containing protein [Burkholderiales bacterium]